MRQESTNQMSYDEDEMLPEYDLENMQGVRGKYYRGVRESHTVHIYQDDGSVQKHHYTLEEGAVMLEPDVRRYFPDSESVNRVLRALIALVPEKLID